MTREDFFKNIDSLVKMVNPKVTNLDSLNASLDELNEKQNNLKIERKDLKSEMTDDRYYDATSEIVDRNNLINLKKKITLVNNKLKNSEKRLGNLIKSEEQTHIKLIGLEASISEDTILLEALNERLNDIKSDESSANYQETIKLTEDNLKYTKDNYDDTKALYDEILTNLDDATKEKEDLDNELASLKEKVNTINTNLKSKDNYLNQDLKEADKEALAKLDDKIKELDDKKLDIINNPVYIVSEIKEYLEKEDIISALNKTKELIAIVEAMPYMDIEDNKKLHEIKESLEQEKIDFVSFTNKKNYDEVNLDFISSRIVYLNNIISNYNEEIDFICKKIRKVDENVKSINDYLKSSLKEVEAIETDITLYQNILNSDEVMTPTRKNQINDILTKKEEQLTVLNRIISSYRLEQTKIVKSIKDVNNNEIAILKDKIAACENEKEDLNKIMNSLKVKNHDFLAEESDKEILRQFDERLKNIDNRLNITESLTDIKANIDKFFDEQAVENEVKTSAENVVFTPIEENLNIEEPKKEASKSEELSFVDFDDNKFLEAPESNVVSINDIISDDTNTLPPLFKEDTETISIFDNEPADKKDEDDEFEFSTVTDFNLPKFYVEEQTEEDPDLIEVIDVSPIVVDNKGE